jgi:hypothetical protein
LIRNNFRCRSNARGKDPSPRRVTSGLRDLEARSTIWKSPPELLPTVTIDEAVPGKLYANV